MKSMILKKVSALLLVAVLGVSLAACGGSASSGAAASGSTSGAASATGEEFVIGNPQPLTGVNAQVGDAANKAAALAVKYINENGGFNGVPVRLINYDDQGSPEEAVKLATKMIQVDKVDAVLGSLTSTCMLAAGKYYNDAKLVTFGTGNSPTWMEQGWDYVFRACLNTALSMPFLGDKMVEMGITSVAVFQGLDDAAKTSAETFIKVCEERGIEVLTTESYTDGDTDYSGQVAKIISKNPDVVFCSTNGPTMAIFAKQLRQLGYNGLAFNREGLTADAISVAGSAADNWVFVYPYVTYNTPDEATDPDMKEFLQLFYDEYGEMPYHDCAYRSWDAMMVMAEAARIAGSNDSEAMRDAVSQIKDFKVLGGVLDFTDGTGEGLHTLNTYIVLDGKYSDFDTWYEEGGYDALKAAA
ncbi:MAG: ABC transporter substrate-binding protein [Oscillospiraceae bacterium]